jgi:hypothetical protein
MKPVTGEPTAMVDSIERPSSPRILGEDRGKVWIAADAFAPIPTEELAVWQDGELHPRS